jgi:type IV pilus assembly protein PilN
MIRINLLPHREIARKERRQRFYVIAGVMVGIGAAIAFTVHMVFAGYIDRQVRKNEIFKAEIKKLDAEIAEIKTLQAQIDALLARKQVIESLQSNRAEAVRLMNELAVRMPEGVYLRSIKQVAKRITLVGYAQSNARVSTLMRALEESEHLTQAQLVEVKAATQGGRRVSEFTVTVGLFQPKPEGSEAAQPAAQTPQRRARR